MRIYKGDIGTTLYADAGTGISTYTSLSIQIIKPDKTVLSLIGTLSGTNQAYIVSDASTFDQEGEYVCNLKVTLPTGSWTGETFTFTCIS